MGFTPTETIWFNGKLVPWDEAKVHVLAHGLQYGTGVFEGMRSYPTADGPAIFRLDAHLERFYKSAELYDLEIPYSQPALTEASLEVVRGEQARGRRTCGRSPSSTPATLSVWTKECPVTVAIAAVPTGKYLANADAGVRVTVSPIRKFDNSAIPAWAKACGQYINSARAVNDAQRRGFDEALLLNSQGLVAEGSGENLFVVKNGAIHTNDKDASILMGVTRASVLEIARDLGIEARVAADLGRRRAGRRRAVLLRHRGRSHARSARSTAPSIGGGKPGPDHPSDPGDVQPGGSRRAAAVPPLALVRPPGGCVA